ncbi:MAG: SRPBCC domain-containing protein [Saprospiraceae bacterium]|nr:SRPBCC domain-containing protein [Saprospiraceae bacterium]
MVKIETSIEINAPKTTVWAVLTDFDAYTEWNPFTPKVELKSKQIGSPVILHVRMNPNSKKLIKQPEVLQRWKEAVYVDWGIEDAWYVKTTRTQRLTNLEGNRTLYYTCDAFRGFLTPLIMFLYRKKIQQGFDEVAAALKKRAEAMV